MTEATRPVALGAPRAMVAAWALVAAVDAVAIAIGAPHRGPGARALHHLYDAGQCLSIGVLSAAALALCERMRVRRGLAMLFVAASALGMLSLPDDLAGLASRLAERAGAASAVPVQIALVALIAAGVPAAAWAGARLDRPGLRAIGAAAGLAAMVANHLVLRADYPGAHLFLSWAATACFAAAIAGAPRPRWAAPDPPTPAAGAALLVLVVATLAHRPDNALLVDVLATQGAPLTPLLARAWSARRDRRDVAVPAELRPWMIDRASAPDVPPTALIARDPIVLLLFVDAMRADVLTRREARGKLPVLTDLAARSVRFEEARSPGSQTVYTFSAVFASRYFSQMYWTPKPPDGLWPHRDTSVRFPELLARAGIPTVTFASARWLVNAFGVVKGFTEETVLRPESIRSALPPARELADHVIARLEAHRGGPLFVFVDFMDAHAPYDRGGTDCFPFDCYVREIALVDREIGRIEQAVDRLGLAARTTIVVASDHGDAFGEHGTTDHGVTLYDELLRVPLLVRSPGAAPRAVETPVSLVDLGPTVLDLMGLPTPGAYMGQSLVPILRGEPASLARPIVAEGRLKRTMVRPDGLKVIRDQRRGTVEVYDVRRDPAELQDLSSAAGAPAAAEGLLDAFFEAQTLKRWGYAPPYRP